MLMDIKALFGELRMQEKRTLRDHFATGFKATDGTQALLDL